MFNTDNHKNNFLVLGEGDTFGINRSFGAPEKMFCVNFSKAMVKVCLSFHYNCDSRYLFFIGKEIFKFKANNGKVNFSTQFCLGCISNGYGATESREVSLKENVYDFSVNYNAIDKSDILHIHKYFMVKNKCLLHY